VLMQRFDDSISMSRGREELYSASLSGSRGGMHSYGESGSLTGISYESFCCGGNIDTNWGESMSRTASRSASSS